MHIRAFVFQRQPLRHAEAVLFVHNHEAEILKLHIVLKQRVSAHGNLNQAV